MEKTNDDLTMSFMKGGEGNGGEKRVRTSERISPLLD